MPNGHSSPSRPDSPPLALAAPLPEWKKRLPMQLTWARIAICVPIVALLFAQDRLGPGSSIGDGCGFVSAGLFILASITDWFDGALARRYGVVSTMGKFMDPIADKILVASALTMLVPSGTVDPILVLLLLARDILVGGLRSVAAADRVVIDARATGKWKTAVQMMGIPLLLVRVPLFGLPLHEVGYGLVWFSVALSALSGIEYARVYLRGRKAQR